MTLTEFLDTRLAEDGLNLTSPVAYTEFAAGVWTVTMANGRNAQLRAPADSKVTSLLAMLYAGHPDYDETWRP